MDQSRKSRLALERLEGRITPAFQVLPTFTTGTTQPVVVASADFNGDGFADAAVGNASGFVEAPTVEILLGAGDGSFTLFQTLDDPLITLPRSITVTELNGDGHIDLVVSSYDSANDAGSLLAYLGQADGSFLAAPVVVSGLPSRASTVRDFTGDGIPDVVSIVPDFGSILGGYEIYAGNGAGAFTFVGGDNGLTFDIDRVVANDFDGDGLNDFISLSAGDQVLFAHYGAGGAKFLLDADGVAFAARDIAQGDFDGDGLIDLAISSDAGVTFHRNLGARQFDLAGVVVTGPSGAAPPRLAAADIDLTGTADIVSVDQTRMRVFYGSFGTGFTEDPTSPHAIPGVSIRNDAAIGDANGDGLPDVITVRQEGASINGSDGRVFLNLARVPTVNDLTLAPSPGVAGTPTILTSRPLFLGNPFPFGVQPSGIVAFDVNGTFFGNGNLANGVASIPANLPVGTHTVLARFPGDARFLASDSDPITITILPAAGGEIYEFEVTGLPTLPGLGSDRVASGNFFPDLVRDIALGSGPGRAAELALIDGKSRTEVATLQPFGPEFTGGLMIAAGDIDGDGTDDVAVAADVGGGPRVTLYLNRNGTLVPTNNFFALDPEFRGGLRVALGDFDGDHLAELVVTGGPGAGPRVATYDGRTLTGFQEPQRLFNDFFALDPDSRLGLFVAVGDLDGDGIPEIAVSSDAGGAPRVLIFDGESLLNNAPYTVADFFSGDVDARGGARIAIRDVSPDAEITSLELIVGDGPGAGSTVRIYRGPSVLGVANPFPAMTSELLPGYLGGVFVA